MPIIETKVPNPESDEVLAAFYAFHTSGMRVTRCGVLCQNKPNFNESRLRQFRIETFKTELDLLNGIIDLVVELDPDILTGWEVQNNSWGFFRARGQSIGMTKTSLYNIALNIEIGLEISSLVSRAPPRFSSENAMDQWGARKASTFKVSGRHVFNLWRIMRSERTLTVYTFENVVFDVLQRRWVSSSINI